MNTTTTAIRAGIARGRMEIRQTFTNGQDLWNYFFPTVILLVVMFFMKDAAVPGTNFSLGSRTLPSVVGMGVAFAGMVTLAMSLAVEREDGTLLRAKAIPNGMLGYLIGKIVLVAGMVVISQVVVLVPSLFMLDGISINWFTLVWVLVLGLVATLPIGAVVRSLYSNPRNAGLNM
ncbi:MAG: ABC transporter permease, partial [Actinomycetes bacterium]